MQRDTRRERTEHREEEEDVEEVRGEEAESETRPPASRLYLSILICFPNYLIAACARGFIPSSKYRPRLFHSSAHKFPLIVSSSFVFFAGEKKKPSEW